MRTVYGKYKDRLVGISGKNRSLCTKKIVKKYSYDVGALYEKVDAGPFLSFLWDPGQSFTLADEKISKKIVGREAKSAENASKVRFRTGEEFLSKQLALLKYLEREAESIRLETGRYDLCVGYPFIFGKINADTAVKAPLILFPVIMETGRNACVLKHCPDRLAAVNKSLILAYCLEHRIKSDGITGEFSLGEEDGFGSYSEIVDFLNANGFKIRPTGRKGLLPFDPSEETPEGMEVRSYAVLGRFPLANSIYDDYVLLEKHNLTSPSIDLLIKGKTSTGKKRERPGNVYAINDLDYAQENAVEKSGACKNLVIYGPPGTGKSRTIINIIGDSLCKNRRVLVVSQKQAALDVVFSGLGNLNSKAMLLPDPEKDRAAFYGRIRDAHARAFREDFAADAREYKDYERGIEREKAVLENIGEVLFTETEFGLSLQEMYARSYNIGRDTADYKLYTAFSETGMAERKYRPLSDDVGYIEDKNIAELYARRAEALEKNDMLAHIRGDADAHKLKEARAILNEFLAKKSPPFDFTLYPRSRYLSAFYPGGGKDEATVEELAEIAARAESPRLAKLLDVSLFPLFWPLFPFIRHGFLRRREEIEIDLNVAFKAFKEYGKPVSALRYVLDEEGYALAVNGIFNGNCSRLEKIAEGLENYAAVKDMNNAISDLSGEIKEILDFAYKNSDGSREDFESVINKILPLRVYREIVKNDDYIGSKLSETINFEDIRRRILKLKTEKRKLTGVLATEKFGREYVRYFEESADSKDFLYQIQKQRGLWPVRKLVGQFQEHLFRLFPCWLLPPRAVSAIFPLKRGLFDLVVFDEASQIFIENALPAIYRGNNVAVAGDNKQLRPSSGFSKRCQAEDFAEDNYDIATREALEAESLLDLASAKYTPVNLIYHYRSDFSELIDFSNMAFYGNKLQVAPNIAVSSANPPIERIKVDGIWRNRRNREEASAVVGLIKKILTERKHNETVGVVTFNAEQKDYIEDLLDAEADKSTSFRRRLFEERNRVEGGENRSVFVKNLENVQGDERDIIIFSIGYAKNDEGKVVAHFGPLSVEGGENRLNVAITRAKKKIYVVTSIEPEELDKSDAGKSEGAKLLKKYLLYARAVSSADYDEVKKILASFDARPKISGKTGSYEERIKEGLEKMGYKVYSGLGNTRYKLSLGVYDEGLGRFVLGIECDDRAYESGADVLERDVYRIKFLENRGWKIVRVWSRDWWQSEKRVLASLADSIESEKTRLRSGG